MEQVAQELLRAIRGDRSQLQFSRRLGFRSDAVAEWEAGRRFPTAAGLFRACQVAGIDVFGAAEGFHEVAAPSLGDASDAGVAAWLSILKGDLSIASLAARIDRSRYAVSRWLSGRTRPRVPDFLRMIDAMTGRLPDFVGLLVSISQVPLLSAVHRRTRRARRLLRDEPWAVAVLALLETGRDLHSAADVSEALRMEVSDASRCIERLVAAGVVRRVRGRLESTGGKLIVDTDVTPGVPEAQKRHWSAIAMERMSTRTSLDAFGYSVFGVSREDLGRIREAHIAYYRQVRAIAAASEPTDTVALLNVQLVDLSPG